MSINEIAEKLGNLGIAGIFALLLVQQFLNYVKKPESANSEKFEQLMIQLTQQIRHQNQNLVRIEAQMTDLWKANLQYRTFIEIQTDVLKQIVANQSKQDDKLDAIIKIID